MYCENCGAQLPDDAKFCDKCGAPVSGQGSGGGSRNGSSGKSPLKGFLKIIIGAAVVCALLFGLFVFWIKTHTNVPTLDPVEPQNSTVTIVGQSGGSATATPTAAAAPTATPTTGSSTVWQVGDGTQTGGNTQPAQTTPAAETTPPGGVMQGAASVGMTDEEKAAAAAGSQAAPSYSADGLPTGADFEWYTGGNYGLNDHTGNNWVTIPDEAVMLTDPNVLKGTWKSLVVYESEDHEPTSYQFFTTTLDYDSGNVTVTYDWHSHYYLSSGNNVDEQDKEDYVCTGTWTEMGIDTSDRSDLIITAFYELNGKQYALGSVHTSSDRRAQLALVRP